MRFKLEEQHRNASDRFAALPPEVLMGFALRQERLKEGAKPWGEK